MRQILSYSTNKFQECVVLEYPKLKINVSTRKHHWHPLILEMKSFEIMEENPRNFTIQTIDNDGNVLNMINVSEIESYKIKDSTLVVKFGYCILNH